ncbi:MAG: CsgG/HfaB family protein [Candidatus Poribacteria bacterium]
MKKLWVSSFLTIISATILFGCLGGSSMPPINLSDYTKIAIAPFATGKESADMADALPYDMGTQLKLKFKKEGKIEWIYYQSKAIQPVREKMTELQFSPEEIYQDPARAKKVGEALGVDLILVGSVSDLRMEKKDDYTPYYDMSQQAGISGTTKYTLLIQSATIDSNLKAVDVKTGNVVWNVEGLKGYIKYIKAFQSQVPVRDAVPDEVIKADMRKHIVWRNLHALYPEGFADREVPEIMMKPSLNLIRGGKTVIW